MKENEIKILTPFENEDARTYFLQNVRSNNLPRSMDNAFLKNFLTTDEFQTTMKGVIERYVSTFPPNTVVDGQRWLVLLGHVGSGKTHSACTIANELMARNYKVTYTTAYNLFTDIKQGYSMFEDRLKNYTNDSVEVLIIDEVGMTKMTDADYTCLFVVLNERYQSTLPTIICSNRVSMEALGEALNDRLNECADTIIFPDFSYRGRFEKDKSIDLEAILRGQI